MVGTRRLFVRLFLGFSDASVVAVEGHLCVRGFGLSSFCEVVLGSLRFCLCIDDVFFFFGEAVSQMVSPRTICCVILKPHSGLKRCFPASVCFFS